MIDPQNKSRYQIVLYLTIFNLMAILLLVVFMWTQNVFDNRIVIAAKDGSRIEIGETDKGRIAIMLLNREGVSIATLGIDSSGESIFGLWSNDQSEKLVITPNNLVYGGNKGGRLSVGRLMSHPYLALVQPDEKLGAYLTLDRKSCTAQLMFDKIIKVVAEVRNDGAVRFGVTPDPFPGVPWRMSYGYDNETRSNDETDPRQ